MGRQSARLYFEDYDHCDVMFQGNYHEKMYMIDEDHGCDGIIWEKLHENNYILIPAYYSRPSGATDGNQYIIYPNEQYAHECSRDFVGLGNWGSFHKTKDYAVMVFSNLYGSGDGSGIYFSTDGKEWKLQNKTPDSASNPTCSTSGNSFIRLANSGRGYYRYDIHENGVSFTKIHDSLPGMTISAGVDEYIVYSGERLYHAFDKNGNDYITVLPMYYYDYDTDTPINNFGSGTGGVINTEPRKKNNSFTFKAWNGKQYAFCIHKYYHSSSQITTNILYAYVSSNGFKSATTVNLLQWTDAMGPTTIKYGYFNNKIQIIAMHNDTKDIRIYEYSSLESSPIVYVMPSNLLPKIKVSGRSTKQFKKPDWLYLNHTSYDTVRQIMGSNDCTIAGGGGYAPYLNYPDISDCIYFKNGHVADPFDYMVYGGRPGSKDNLWLNYTIFAVVKGNYPNSNAKNWCFTSKEIVVDKTNETWGI